MIVVTPAVDAINAADINAMAALVIARKKIVSRVILTRLSRHPCKHQFKHPCKTSVMQLSQRRHHISVSIVNLVSIVRSIAQSIVASIANIIRVVNTVSIVNIAHVIITNRKCRAKHRLHRQWYRTNLRP